MTVSTCVAPGLAVTQQMAIETDIIIRTVFRMAASVHPDHQAMYEFRPKQSLFHKISSSSSENGQHLNFNCRLEVVPEAGAEPEPNSNVWPLTSLIEDGEEGGADHDADHEAGEHHAEGGGARVQDRGPQEDEDVHAGLKQSLTGAQQQHLEIKERDLFKIIFCEGLVKIAPSLCSYGLNT